MVARFVFSSIFICFLITYLNCNCYSVLADQSSQNRDSGFKGLEYKEIVENLKELSELYPQSARFYVYGKSVKNRPLVAIRIGHEPQQIVSKHPAVLITGATHGNEFLGIEDRLPEAFIKKSNSQSGISQFIKAGGLIYIVPVYNPDAYEEGWRHNLHDRDLNSDFPIPGIFKSGFTQPENKNFSNFLESEIGKYNLDLKLTMDYHCCGNKLVYPWGHKLEAISPIDLAEFIKYAVLMQIEFGKSYAFGSSFEMIGEMNPGISTDFYYSTFGAISFTFEGIEKLEHKNFDKHLAMWDLFLRKLSSDSVVAKP